jgi:hypothetical protein
MPPIGYALHVLVPVERLLLRIRQVPSRARELVALRRRLHRDPHAGDEERALAEELRTLKLRIAAAVGAVSSCGGCATGPRTAFAGGACCSGVTAELFSDDELAALALAGTRPRHLRAPRSEHDGCAFRALDRCTLAVEHRPQRCVHYTCDLLRRELHARGELDTVEALLDELQHTMQRFVALRGTRLDDELFAGFEDAVTSAIS